MIIKFLLFNKKIKKYLLIVNFIKCKKKKKGNYFIV